MASLRASWDPTAADHVGRLRAVPVGANGQPALATYWKVPGDTAFRAAAIVVLRIRGGQITEVTAFHDPGLFPAFGLAPVLDR